MPEFLQQSEAQVVLWLTVLALLCAVGYYVVDKVRRGFTEPPPGSNELMGDFRELRDKGELSDEEYRVIKSKLAQRLVDEVKRNDEDA